MSLVRRRLWAALGGVLAGIAGVLLTDAPLGAQQRDIPSPRVQPLAPRYRLTAERAQAFSDASVRQIEYLPGEALVRFRWYVSSAGRQRALNALTGQPRLGDLEWHGPIAIVRDGDSVLVVDRYGASVPGSRWMKSKMP